MAFEAIVTPDDLKRGDLVEPGWYPVEIVKYEEKDAATDKSTNCIFHFKVLDGDGKGNQFKTQFNQKALGFGKKLYAVLKLEYDKVKGYTLNTKVFEAQVGKKLKVYVKRGKSNQGNEFNEVADYDTI